MKTAEQIAEEAAQKVCEENGIERAHDGESWVQALAWEMGEGLTYESGMQALVTSAIEVDRAQPRFLLISEHDDTGVIGLYETREAAIDTAILNCDNDPEIWNDYYSIQEV